MIGWMCECVKVFKCERARHNVAAGLFSSAGWSVDVKRDKKERESEEVRKREDEEKKWMSALEKAALHYDYDDA